MINIIVILEVKDFSSLSLFETQAADIMRSHGGRIISAFETIRNDNGSGQEIHLLEFPNDAAFADYRADSRLLEHTELRNKAIDATKVMISKALKFYS